MFTGAEAIRQSLLVLGQKISRSGRGRVCVVICGGSALNLSGLIARTTEDVDALGVETGALEIESLPEWLLQCAEEVANELGLEEEWFNDAASVLKSFGFPQGMMKRARREQGCPRQLGGVGQSLTLWRERSVWRTWWISFSPAF